MTIADRIRNKRNELKLSQSDLAERANYCDKTRISKIENSGNDISMKQVKRIAAALGVSTECLMGWENPEQQIREAYYQGGIRRTITDREVDLIILYRAASRDIQTAIDKILGLENVEKRDIG